MVSGPMASVMKARFVLASLMGLKRTTSQYVLLVETTVKIEQKPDKVSGKVCACGYVAMILRWMSVVNTKAMKLCCYDVLFCLEN